MQTLEKLLKIIDQSHQEGVLLDLEGTVAVFNALQQISTEKSLIEKLIQFIFQVKQKKKNLKTLTQRENEVFRRIGLGYSSREIAVLMKISEETVSTHRKNINKKLGLSGQGQLQKLAQQVLQSQVA